MTELREPESLPVCATCGAATPIVEIGGVRWHTHGGYLMYRCDAAALDAAERAYWQDDGVSRHNLAAAIRAYLSVSCPPAPSPEPRPEELTVASANVAFLKAHPEYQDVYSWGILTTRLPGEGFEHYRYAADLLGLDRGSPRPTGESGAAESGGR